MKKILSTLLISLLMLLLVIPASADTQYIYDPSGRLPDVEYDALQSLAQDLSPKNDCSLYFVMVDNYQDYGTGSIFEVSRKIYEANQFGAGSDKSGVMLILSMEDRDYCLLAHGFGDTALTDYGKDYISEHFLDNFGDDDWFGGAVDYLTYTDELLTQARSGNIYDRASANSGTLWLWSILLGAGLSSMICLIQRNILRKRVHTQSQAQAYLDEDASSITRREDRYTHTTVVRREIQENKSSSSSGSHSHSGGYSGKSGKF